MLQSFRHADFDALAELWSGFFPQQYWVDPELMRLNTVQCPVFDWGASLIHAPDGPPLGFAVVKKDASGRLYPGPKTDNAYLCAIAYQAPQTAVDLLAVVKTILRDRGVQRLHFGQDAWHFFPGCPEDFAALRNLLMVEGFVEGPEQFDMERDLDGYEARRPLPGGYEVRPLSDEVLPALTEFLTDEFPGRWMYDVVEKVRREGCPECVLGLFEGERLVGFARVQKWDDKIPMAGGVWRRALGERWGSVGPIGVAKRLRGKGLGHGLLGAALEHLKGLGVKRCVIDWTVQDRFYAEHGFEITRRYKSMHLDLDALPSAQPKSRGIGLH